MIPEFVTLQDFLRWLASTPGALVAAGFFVAYVLERFSVWKEKVPHDLKTVTTIAIAVAISYVGRKYLNVPVIYGNPELNQAFYMLIYYAGNQISYKRYFKS